jgi:hypothetical protein
LCNRNRSDVPMKHAELCHGIQKGKKEPHTIRNVEENSQYTLELDDLHSCTFHAGVDFRSVSLFELDAVQLLEEY